MVLSLLRNLCKFPPPPPINNHFYRTSTQTYSVIFSWNVGFLKLIHKLSQVLKSSLHVHIYRQTIEQIYLTGLDLYHYIDPDLLAFLRSLTNSADCWCRISEFRDSFSNATTSSWTRDLSFLSLCKASERSRLDPSGRSCDILLANAVSEPCCSASYITRHTNLNHWFLFH